MTACTDPVNTFSLYIYMCVQGKRAKTSQREQQVPLPLPFNRRWSKRCETKFHHYNPKIKQLKSNITRYLYKKYEYHMLPSLTLLNPEEGGKIIRNVRFKIIQRENIANNFSFIGNSLLFISGLPFIQSWAINLSVRLQRKMYLYKISDFRRNIKNKKFHSNSRKRSWIKVFN